MNWRLVDDCAEPNPVFRRNRQTQTIRLTNQTVAVADTATAETIRRIAEN